MTRDDDDSQPKPVDDSNHVSIPMRVRPKESMPGIFLKRTGAKRSARIAALMDKPMKRASTFCTP